MPLLGCEVPTLNVDASCYNCLSVTDLIKAMIFYREQIYADGAATTPRTAAQVLKDSVAWRTMSEHQRMAIEVAQLANDAVIRDAITSPSAAEALRDTACYCGAGDGDLRAANAYLECLIRNLG